MKVLYVSHGHPYLAKGGGEIAAWRLFEHFSERCGSEVCGFLAAAPTVGYLPPGCEVMSMGFQQWLIKPSSNALIHDTAVSLRCDSQLARALGSFQPDLIHLHHYLHVGIDLVHALRRWFPTATVVLTLHEYWGPCAFEGRLLRSNGELCTGGDPEACNQCLGGHARDGLAIRELRVQRLFAVIDHFIAPSFFLKQRYLHWGVPANRISVIENLPVNFGNHKHTNRQLYKSECVNIAYYGQLNPWKGVDRILEALLLAKELHYDGMPKIRLDIHGPVPIDSDSLFWRHCLGLIERLGSSTVRLCGIYAPQSLPELMDATDWIVMGSIWCENSPMVIQEAYSCGRPVLAPNLGAIPEKVRHGVSGWLYQTAEIKNLADAIVVISSFSQSEYASLCQGALRMSARQVLAGNHHESLYKKILA